MGKQWKLAEFIFLGSKIPADGDCSHEFKRRLLLGKKVLNMMSRLVIPFLPRSKRLLNSWLQSPFAVILEPPKIKSATVSTDSPSICHEVKFKPLYGNFIFKFLISFSRKVLYSGSCHPVVL